MPRSSPLLLRDPFVKFDAEDFINFLRQDQENMTLALIANPLTQRELISYRLNTFYGSHLKANSTIIVQVKIIIPYVVGSCEDLIIAEEINGTQLLN